MQYSRAFLANRQLSWAEYSNLEPILPIQPALTNYRPIHRFFFPSIEHSGDRYFDRDTVDSQRRLPLDPSSGREVAPEDQSDNWEAEVERIDHYTVLPAQTLPEGISAAPGK